MAGEDASEILERKDIDEIVRLDTMALLGDKLTSDRVIDLLMEEAGLAVPFARLFAAALLPVVVGHAVTLHELRRAPLGRRPAVPNASS